MRNKIMMMVLLCALLVGLVPPGSARAEDAGYAFSEWCEDNGLVCGVASDEDWSGVDKHFKYDSSCSYFVKVLSSDVYCFEVNPNSLNNLSYYFNGSKLYYYVNNNSGYFTLKSYKYSSDGWHYLNSEEPNLFSGSSREITTCSSDVLIYSSDDIYASNLFTEISYAKTSAPLDLYTFVEWCTDAGLNYAPSSNDLGLIKYGYEGYMHIVRRTGTDKYGRWILTTIGNSVYADNAEDFTVMVDENGQLGVWCLYSGEEEGGYQLFVRNYVYDTDGWRLMSYELFDVREDDDYIIELGEDSSINDYSLLAYSNVDIYSSSLNLTYPASTEFVDVNDVLPDVPEQPEEPSVTPTVAPLPTVVPPSVGSDVEVPKFDIDWNNIGLNDIPEVIGQVKDAVLGFFDIVGVVPLMIGAVFGFLPSWCLWMFGLSFALLGVLLVIKLIRG